MKAGDLVRTDPWIKDPWIKEGTTGIVISVQEVEYCIGAYVLIDNVVELISVDNLHIINESP